MLSSRSCDEKAKTSSLQTLAQTFIVGLNKKRSPVCHKHSQSKIGPNSAWLYLHNWPFPQWITPSDMSWADSCVQLLQGAPALGCLPLQARCHRGNWRWAARSVYSIHTLRGADRPGTESILGVRRAHSAPLTGAGSRGAHGQGWSGEDGKSC